VDEQQWRERQAAHAARVDPWVKPRLERRYIGEKHPVDDFLFDYYPYSIGKLTTWNPGYGVILEGDAEEFLTRKDYVRTDAGVTLGHEGLVKRAKRLPMAIEILRNTKEQKPQFGCFGMHEWAMVYRIQPDEVRHENYPLRLSPQHIEDVVNEVGLRCTHFDAFRFFTHDAIPLNVIKPTRASQADDDQPGCVHASMDLYKYAMWAGPYIASELAADCFEFARTARTLDMRASPYDLESLGYEPIAMETVDGRAEYVRAQRSLMEAAAPLRDQLLARFIEICDASNNEEVSN
jgi:hypothetical protein